MPSRTGSIARVVTTACLLAAANAALAQVSGVEVYKQRSYHQSAADRVTGPSFEFIAKVHGPNLAAIAAPVVSGAFGSGTMGNPGAWFYFAQASSQAALDARFPSGNYTITAEGTSYTLALNGDAYGNAPVFTLEGGAWVDGQYLVDPAQPLSVATNASTGYGGGVEGSIHVFLGRAGANVFDHTTYRSSAPGASSARISIPAGTMVAGHEYYLAAAYSTYVDYRPGAVLQGASYLTVTTVTVKAERPQVFPLTVSSSITPTVANATATFQPRAQDAGKEASVFVFAVAPSSLVQGALAKGDGPTWKATGAKADPPVQCVLAQLGASGQLQAVSAAALRAFVSGQLSAAGQSVTILNNVPTPQVAGSVFYIGYGTNAQQMLASGVNQRALAVGGNVACDPRLPQTGWWYNADEGGRGFSIEAKGPTLFFGAFHYDADGRAVWNYAGGPTSIDGSLFTADFIATSNGQTLNGPYRAPAFANAGTVTLAFSDATHGTISWPGGIQSIERLPFVPNGLAAPPQSGVPEAGWWWNPAESGRGFFVEWQNGWFHIAGYMYDEAGRPTWYLSAYPSPDPMRVSGNWWLFGNGQAPGQPYRPATRLNDNVGSLDIQFTNSTTGTLTLPDGRRVPFVRMPF